MECGENIKQYRTEKGCTQEELAKAVGVSRQSVARWENGWVVPTLFYAKRLAEFFGITVEELIGGKAEKKVNVPLPFKSNTAKAARFSILTFIPVALYCILYSLTHSIYRYFAVNGAGQMYDTLFSAAYNVLAALCYCVFAVELAFWIIRLISDFKNAPDSYLRYELYRKWNIGLIFFTVNLFAFLLRWSVSLFILLPYAYALTVTALADFIFDTIIKKACAKRLTVPKNPHLKLLNTVFVSIAAVILTAVIIGVIFFFVTRGGTWIAGAFLMILSGIAALAAAISYIVLYAVISLKTNTPD